MTLEEVVVRMQEKPYILEMGKSKISKWLGCSIEDVKKAKIIIRDKREPKNTLPKILLIDIETSPLLALVYQKQVWKARIGADKIVSDWFILTFSCKWLGEDEIISDRLTSMEAEMEDDNRLVRKLWYILSDADIVVAHNGDNFDIPNINARFIIHGLGPTTHYKQVDTLKVAQRNFGFTHNGLDALAKTFGIPGKIETSFQLWKDCIRGVDSALRQMEIYNRHDVEMLEAVYLKLRPWIKSHVNVSVYNNNVQEQCPHCGSSDLKQEGNFYTHTGKYPTYRCNSCGAMSRERKTILSKEKSKGLLISIPGR